MKKEMPFIITVVLCVSLLLGIFGYFIVKFPGRQANRASRELYEKYHLRFEVEAYEQKGLVTEVVIRSVRDDVLFDTTIEVNGMLHDNYTEAMLMHYAEEEMKGFMGIDHEVNVSLEEGKVYTIDTDMKLDEYLEKNPETRFLCEMEVQDETEAEEMYEKLLESEPWFHGTMRFIVSQQTVKEVTF